MFDFRRYRDDWSGGHGDWGPHDRMQGPGHPPNMMNRPPGARDKGVGGKRGRRNDEHSVLRHHGYLYKL